MQLRKGNDTRGAVAAPPFPGSVSVAARTACLLAAALALSIAAGTVQAQSTNLPPVADAGGDVTTAPGVAVKLDGSGSSDPDGDALAYTWAQTGGPGVTLADADTATPSFEAPGAPGALSFRLTVSDPGGLTDSDTLTVTASPVHRVPLLPPASHPYRQGFVRVINRSAEVGEVSVAAFDDAGTEYGPLTLRIGANAAVHFSSHDLEQGNVEQGISGGVGEGEGAWRLELISALDLEVLSYVRVRDGALASLHDVVPEDEAGHRVVFFNPASNRSQVSRLRLINPGEAEAAVRINGIDAAGGAGESAVALTLPGRASRSLSAQALESGEGEGLSGALGDGAGKWRLRVTAGRPIRVMSLLASGPHLTNLSTVPTSEGTVHRVPLLPPASHPDRQGFVRVINRSAEAGEVSVAAFDDAGTEYEPLMLHIGANAAMHFSSLDLERGNAERGLSGGGVGEGEGDWRLELTSALDLEVLSYLRVRGGALASLHDVVPEDEAGHRVVFFNPASNRGRVSRLRLINPGDEAVTVRITGIDAAGEAGESAVALTLRGRTSRSLSAQALESGEGEGLSGALGDGAGKWRLHLSADRPIQAMSLLASGPHLTNLSSIPDDGPVKGKSRVPVFVTAREQIVAENTKTVVTLVANAASDDPVTFAITGGADAARFTLTEARLAFRTAPDHEVPADADGDNVYEVAVKASGESGGTDSLALRVTVQKVVDGGMRLVGGNSALEGRVEVYSSGQWGTVCDDFWDATDATVACRQLGYHSGTALGEAHFGRGSGPIWLDDVGCTGSESRLIDCPRPSHRGVGSHNCNHGDDAGVRCTAHGAPAFTTAATQSVPENTRAVASLGASDPNGDPVTFAITGGADAAHFTLTAGWLVFRAAPDYEAPADANGDNVYEVTVEASDGDGGTDSLALRVTVTDVANDTPPPPNRAPAFTTPAAQSVPENTTAVVKFEDSDPDNDPVAFTITGGADAARFVLIGELLAFRAAPDFEAPADADGNNVYEVTVEASDERGGTASLALQVAVTDVTEPVSGDLRLAGGSSALEGRVEVYHSGQWGTVCDDFWEATDATVACRQLGYHSGTALEEAHFGRGSGPIWLDDVGCTGSESRLIDCPRPSHRGVGRHNCNHGEDAGVRCTANAAPAFTTAAAQSVPENTRAVASLGASDPNGDPVTFAITGGADAAHFTLTAGWLVFRAAPDYEAPADANGDNVYEVTVEASDGDGGTDSLALRVTVTDVANDTPPPPNRAPAFTTPAAQSVPENTTAVVKFEDGDPDNDPVAFTITGGADAARFVLIGELLAFRAAPDYEAPADADGNNLYEVTVEASDGRGGTASLALQVTVTDVAEPVTGDLRLVGGSSALEGRVEVYHSGQWGTVCDDFWEVTDATVACRQLGYHSGTAHEEAHFGRGSGPIWLDDVGCTGSESRLIDCPRPSHRGVGSHNCNHGDDAGATCTAHAAPSFTTAAAQSVPENTRAVVALAASDPNGDPVTFTITGGADQARFTLIAGWLTFLTAPDYEAPADANGDNVYEVTVKASDGNGGTDSLALRVTVIDVVEDSPPPANRTPAFTTTAAQSVPENTTAVVTLAASDPDHDPVTFTITGGADQARFALSVASLAFGTAPDYEAPADADGDNVYEVTVEASDGRGGTASLALQVTVTDVAEPVTGDLRLVGGSSALEGRVEVYNSGQWGTVCDDLWDDTDATVACRQLGHLSGTAHGRAHFGRGSGPIWLDDVGCTGSESRLIDCPRPSHRPVGSHNCNHGDDAGATCTANEES